MKETQQRVMDIHFPEVNVSILSDNVLKIFFKRNLVASWCCSTI
jgi:hypothetical protein